VAPDKALGPAARARIYRHGAAQGPVAEALRHRMRDPILTVSITTRIATTLGITFLMVQQPGLVTAVVVIVLAAGIGGFAGLLLGRRGSSPDAIGRDAARSRGTESL
jgi:hypothetical protein